MIHPKVDAIAMAGPGQRTWELYSGLLHDRQGPEPLEQLSRSPRYTHSELDQKQSCGDLSLIFMWDTSLKQWLNPLSNNSSPNQHILLHAYYVHGTVPDARHLKGKKQNIPVPWLLEAALASGESVKCLRPQVLIQTHHVQIWKERRQWSAWRSSHCGHLHE